MNKVIRNGKVAVLYTRGYGAGWSSWNDNEKTFLLFDPEIVDAVEKSGKKLAAEIAEKRGKELFGDDDYTCVAGADNLKIGWIREGTAFNITDHDGFETINIVSNNFIIA